MKKIIRNKREHKRLWDLFKIFKMHAIQVPKVEGEKNETETICTEIMSEKFPKLVKNQPTDLKSSASLSQKTKTYNGTTLNHTAENQS